MGTPHLPESSLSKWSVFRGIGCFRISVQRWPVLKRHLFDFRMIRPAGQGLDSSEGYPELNDLSMRSFHWHLKQGNQPRSTRYFASSSVLVGSVASPQSGLMQPTIRLPIGSLLWISSSTFNPGFYPGNRLGNFPDLLMQPPQVEKNGYDSADQNELDHAHVD